MLVLYYVICMLFIAVYILYIVICMLRYIVFNTILYSYCLSCKWYLIRCLLSWFIWFSVAYYMVLDTIL